MFYMNDTAMVNKQTLNSKPSITQHFINKCFNRNECIWKKERSNLPPQ